MLKECRTPCRSTCLACWHWSGPADKHWSVRPSCAASQVLKEWRTPHEQTRVACRQCSGWTEKTLASLAYSWCVPRVTTGQSVWTAGTVAGTVKMHRWAWPFRCSVSSISEGGFYTGKSASTADAVQGLQRYAGRYLESTAVILVWGWGKSDLSETNKTCVSTVTSTVVLACRTINWTIQQCIYSISMQLCLTH